MEATILNFTLYLVLFLSYIRKRKQASPVSLLLLLYVIVAFMAVLYFPDFVLRGSIKFWPYFYLFCVIYLFVLPLIKVEISTDSVKNITINKTINIIALLYIFFSIISIIRYASIAYQAIILGDWLAVKNMVRDGEMGISTGLIYSMAKAYTVAFMPGMIVYAFLSFVKKTDKIWKSLLLLIIAVLPDLLSSVVNAYRGGFLTLSLLLLSCFMIFKDIMPLKKKRFLYMNMTIFVVFMILINYSITTSRFGDGNSSNSLLQYVGQPMLFFNGGIATRIKDYADGAYFFQNFNHLTREQIWVDSKFGTLTYDGSALNTFVGCSYIDFGPYITLALALFVSLALIRILTKGVLDFSKLYLYTFYLNYLFLGAFHSSMGFSMYVIFACFFYYIIKKSIKNNNINNNKVYGC